MDKIKMSEVFELPVKKTQGGVLPFLRDSNPMCNTIFVGSDNHVDVTVIAINAYDANQESLKKLRGAIFNVNNDNIDLSKEIADQNRKLKDKAKLIEFTDKANSQMSEEIAKLKSLAAYAEQRANIAEKANDALVLKNASLSSQVTRGVDDCNKLVIENNELKARTIVLKVVLDEFDRYMGDNMEYRQSAFASKVHCALVNTKVQSLQSVKADAVNEFANETCGDCKTLAETWMSQKAYDYCIKLREGKS